MSKCLVHIWTENKLDAFLPSRTPSHSHSAFASDCNAMVACSLCDENGLFLLTKHRIKIIG